MRDSEPIGNYAHVWSKYKPVIVKMMVDSKQEGAQEYQLSKHEFVDVNPKRVTGYNFDIEIIKGRILAEPKGNLLLKDLMYVLKRSEKASILMEYKKFNMVLNKEFKLTVNSEAPEEN